MAKSKISDIGFVCWIPAPDDYQFIPTQRLNGHYVVGVNSDSPVYLQDSPELRHKRHRARAYEEFNRRIDAGENLHPQPTRRPRYFAITARGVFHFGYTDIDIYRTLEGDESATTIHPERCKEGDAINVEFHTVIDPKFVSIHALTVIL